MRKSYQPNPNVDVSKQVRTASPKNIAVLRLLRSRWLGLFICLMAFAANSLLCRMALSETDIDPLLFSNLRLLSGASVLLLLVLLQGGKKGFVSNISKPTPTVISDKPRIIRLITQWQGGFYLFIYMLGFSIAYQELATGIGALLLFGAVQMTMTLIGFYRGEFPSIRQWLGWGIALSGLILLVFQNTNNGYQNSSWYGVVWMMAAGIGWGLYTAYGQNSAVDSKNPIDRTRNYFIQASFLIVLLTFILTLINVELFEFLNNQLNTFDRGIWLALGSGAVTSALGYVLWYQVLPLLSTLEAAASQLVVPIIAAAFGILLLAEPLTPSFVIASILAIGGLALVIIPHK